MEGLFRPREEGAGLLRAIADCHHRIYRGVEDLHQPLGPLTRDLYPEFCHHPDGAWVEHGGVGTGAEGLEPVREAVPEEPFGHLGSGRVVCAEEEDAPGCHPEKRGTAIPYTYLAGLPTLLHRMTGTTDSSPTADWFPLPPGVQAGTVSCGGRSVDRFEAEFWTSRQRQAHSLHELSYRACFKPQLPRFFIERLTGPGDLVYDPFSGRGTTALEAALLDRRVAANDANPLSAHLAAPRLAPPPGPVAVADRLASYPVDTAARADRDLSMFYHPGTEARLVSLRQVLVERARSGTEDALDRWIRMVATNRLSGHSRNFFSVYTLPPNQAASPESQRRINRRLEQVPPLKDVNEIVVRKTSQLLRDLSGQDRARLARRAEDALFMTGDARSTPALASNSVRLTVTSPPFLDQVAYTKDNWLRCWFNGLNEETVGAGITMSRTVASWSVVMGAVFAELARVTAPGGHVAFEVGEVRRSTIPLDEYVVPLGEEAGLTCLAIFVNRSPFTKTSHIWGVSNHRRGTNSNRIVLFRKE